MNVHLPGTYESDSSSSISSSSSESSESSLLRFRPGGLKVKAYLVRMSSWKNPHLLTFPSASTSLYPSSLVSSCPTWRGRGALSSDRTATGTWASSQVSGPCSQSDTTARTGNSPADTSLWQCPPCCIGHTCDTGHSTIYCRGPSGCSAPPSDCRGT